MERYALLKIEIAKLSKEAETLVPEIIQEMTSNDQKKVEGALGNFTITNLKKWKYPQALVEKEEKLKAEKAKAQSTGDATFDEEPSLTFRVIKL